MLGAADKAALLSHPLTAELLRDKSIWYPSQVWRCEDTERGTRTTDVLAGHVFDVLVESLGRIPSGTRPHSASLSLSLIPLSRRAVRVCPGGGCVDRVWAGMTDVHVCACGRAPHPSRGGAKASHTVPNIRHTRRQKPRGALALRNLTPYPPRGISAVLDPRVVARADGHNSAARGPPAALDILT